MAVTIIILRWIVDFVLHVQHVTFNSAATAHLLYPMSHTRSRCQARDGLVPQSAASGRSVPRVKTVVVRTE